MKSEKIIPYPIALKIAEIGYMRDVKMWYTHNSPTLIDGLIMHERVAPAYNMTEGMLDMIYIPAPTISEAIDFLNAFYRDPYAIELKYQLTNFTY